MRAPVQPAKGAAPLRFAPIMTSPDAPGRVPDPAEELAKLGDLAAEAGIHRVSMLAWRDLDDPEAGGSEVHASMVAALWGQAGIEVTMRTSYAAGRPRVSWRDGYRVVRKAGRYMVFPRAAMAEMLKRHGPRDGLVEIWNGMPFFSPVWATGPRIVFLHHLHAEMWQMTLPPRLAALGNALESRVAPPLYHRTPIVTLSSSSKEELVEDMGFRSDRVTVVPPGVDPRFAPGGAKSPTPLIVAAGRLVPVKRFEEVIEVLLRAKERQPELEAVIVGEGYRRDALEAQLRERSAEKWIRLAGRVSDTELIDLYRRAWLVVSAAAREGWGMTITEAGACGTPAVATRIAGHRDAVDDGRSGLLVDTRDEFVDAVDQVLRDRELRARLAAAAVEHASRFTWAATARGTLEVLAADAIRRRSRT
jgi:glycosyltransferase involved in cell wall biosynthesis